MARLSPATSSGIARAHPAAPANLTIDDMRLRSRIGVLAQTRRNRSAETRPARDTDQRAPCPKGVIPRAPAAKKQRVTHRTSLSLRSPARRDGRALARGRSGAAAVSVQARPPGRSAPAAADG